MWPNTFVQRLQSWADLRQTCVNLDTESCLNQINTWWSRSPWAPYYLHWDDRENWPDPWQLLSDNFFCDVARGLGMLYTIAMLERHDLEDAVLVDDSNHTLVLVQGEKYILNWDTASIVNINLGPIKARRLMHQHQILNKIQ